MLGGGDLVHGGAALLETRSVLRGAEKWGGRAPGSGSWALDGGARVSATRRVISRFALVCELLPTIDEAGVQTGRGKKNPPDLRRSQNAAATRATLRGLVPCSAAGTAYHRESVRPAAALPA